MNKYKGQIFNKREEVKDQKSKLIRSLVIFKGIWLSIKFVFWVTWKILSSSVYLYGLYCIFTILGLLHHPFWYGLLLTYYVFTSKILQKVLDAIWIPIWEILWTFGLYFGTIFLFNLVYYSWYGEEYPNNTCYSLF